MEPHFDYIRIATWAMTDYLSTTANLLRQGGYKPARWLQYKGRKSADGRLFFGMGEQNRKRHHVIQMSGGLAEDNAPIWLNYPESFYCTRLDIQVTILEPPEHDGESLYKRLHRKTKSIVKSPGSTTVYLGARTSDLFTRIYEKPIDGKRYLRCEFELKGQYSRAAFDALCDGTMTINRLFQQCLNQAQVPAPQWDWFALNGDKTKGLLRATKYKDLAAIKAWLDNTEAGIMRHIGHEDTRGMVVAFIERLETAREYAENFDRSP